MNVCKFERTDDTPSRRPHLTRWIVAAAVVGLVTGASTASAEESALSKDAKQVGHAVGNVAHDIGQTAKRVGTEIGHDAVKASKEVGPAAKEAGSDIGSAFSDFGHKIGHAAKQSWEAVVSWFHSKN